MSINFFRKNQKKIILIIGGIVFLVLNSYWLKYTIETIGYHSQMDSKEDVGEYGNYQKNKNKENDFYRSLVEQYKNIDNIQKEPYLPEGFGYVEGESETGYVVQDENLNQYVWVPCDVTTLKKQDFDANAFVSCYQCVDEEYEKFLESALLHGGFYVSRFEIGKENGKPVSKFGAVFLNQITYDEAKKIAETMVVDSEINSSLLNGYAYDTMLFWVMQTNNRDLDILNKVNFTEKQNTGLESYNHIYDLFDNKFEMTLENYFDTIVYRGFLKEKNGVKDIHFGMWDSRLTTNTDAKEEFLGFRVMLYK